MTHRVYNFSAGPAVLPLPVLETAQSELVALPGIGMSILEISHRGAAFAEILQAAKDRLRRLLKLPENYTIMFLQGGSRLQFSMVPMNLLRGDHGPADYILTGSWGNKAIEEARKAGPVNVAWDGADTKYDRIPEQQQLRLTAGAEYVHCTSNETIEGVQFPSEPDVGDVPLVCDASSDFLHRPIPIEHYGLLYACAQKNAGPAGVTVVIIRDDLLGRSSDTLPGYLNYRLHAQNDSLYNTPSTFGIYIVGLVAKWLLDDIGGLDAMYQINRMKAEMLYEVIDESEGFFKGHARPDCRSVMNVTFRLPNEDLQSIFLKEAEASGLHNLKGHRSVGGIRASIYNAMPIRGVESLRGFMRSFLKSNAH